LSVCLSRVLKDELSVRMRTKMKTVQVPSDEPFREEIVNLFGVLLTESKAGNYFWEQDIRRMLAHKYRDCLDPEEENSTFNLKTHLDIRVTLVDFFTQTLWKGIELTEKAERGIYFSPFEYKMLESDIIQILPRRKHLFMTYFSSAMKNQILAQKSEQASEKRRLLQFAKKNFKIAVGLAPACYLTSFLCAGTIKFLTEITKNVNKKQKLLEESLECYKRSWDNIPTHEIGAKINLLKPMQAKAMCDFLKAFIEFCISNGLNDKAQTLKTLLDEKEKLPLSTDVDRDLRIILQ